MRILVVEDERGIAAEIAISLEDAGFCAELSHDGDDAWFRGDTEEYDAAVLDLGLSGIDGLTVLRRWRAEGRQFPVIILTARDGWMSRVQGINAGADDYLTKPFQMEELIARLRAVLRRTHGHAGPTLKAGSIALDMNDKKLHIDGRTISLTTLEFRLVSYLLHHKGRVIPSVELREHVYGDSESREANAVEAMIVRLRRKLGPNVIETRRGHGYCMKGQESCP